MNKLFFIVGIRRSGTSILRELILKHPEVDKILFEPYELWHAIRVSHLGRYKNDPYVKKIIQDFSYAPGKYKGAKFALNTCLESMTWRRLALVFPEAKFIFIIRDAEQTYKSWVKQDKDSVRGLCSKELYMGFREHITQSFIDFTANNINKSCILFYKDLVKLTDFTMVNIWRTLNITPITGLQKYIKIPENWNNK